jgi:hypothetical protein
LKYSPTRYREMKPPGSGNAGHDKTQHPRTRASDPVRLTAMCPAGGLKEVIGKEAHGARRGYLTSDSKEEE